MKIARLWPLSWILVIPLISLLGIWGAGTAEMYRELGLRNLADERLGGMTLRKAGELQLHYLVQSVRRGAIRSVTLGSEEALPRVHLFAQSADIEALDEHRPLSGQQYVPARLYKDGEFSKVQIRYRGDFANHWGLFKRSFRVKTKRSDLFHGLRRFNLIIPKDEILYRNHAGYEMARLVGVLAPRSEVVSLNLNGQDRGVHLLVEQISETTLRDSGRLPGDIYSGDELYGLEIWGGIDLKLFDSVGFWKKVAVNNHYPEQHKAPLKALLGALNRGDTGALESLVDLESFARFNLWEQLALSKHTDDMHNWRLYYDPGVGRFYPILWDGIPWSVNFVSKDVESWQPPDKIVASRLMEALLASPRFEEIRLRIFADFFAGQGPAELVQMLEDLNQRVGRVLDTDAAILDGELNWKTPEESLAQMQLTLRVVKKNLAHMNTLYQQALPLETPVLEPVLWSGTVNIKETLYLDRPLQIDPGTRIILADGVSLFLRAGVSALGTRELPVSFQPEAGGLFGTVVIEGQASNGSVLEHFSMTGGTGYKDDLRTYSGMLSIHDVDDMKLRFCHLSRNQRYDDQLHVVYSRILVEDCVFEQAPMDAVDLDMSEAEFRRTRFLENGNDGLDLMGTRIFASQLDFVSNGDKGISVGERSLLDVADSSFNGNQIGIQVKDDSLVIGRHLSFASRDMKPLDAYAKNWRYGTGGSGWFCETLLEPDQQVTTDRDSRMELSALPCSEVKQGDFRAVRQALGAQNE